MKTKIRAFMASFVVASVALMSATGSAKAADDKWFVLGQQTIKSTDPSVTITSEGNRRDKDVKQVKLSVEGADVQITNVVLHWDNRRDDTLKDVGLVKSGGQTAAKDAPGLKARLTSVSVQYKIVGMRRRPMSRSGDLTERAVPGTGARQASLSCRLNAGQSCRSSDLRKTFGGGAVHAIQSRTNRSDPAVPELLQANMELWSKVWLRPS